MADAYDTVANIQIYIEKFRALPTAWSALSVTEKDQTVRKATRYLDMVYQDRWVGERADSDQDLDWPRRNAADPDGYAIDSTTVPQCVKDACAEATMLEITETGGLFPTPDNTDAIQREMFQLGDIKEDITYAGTKEATQTFPVLDKLLFPVLVSGNRLYLG